MSLGLLNDFSFCKEKAPELKSIGLLKYPLLLLQLLY